MDKLTEIYTIRFSEKQIDTLRKLRECDVNISGFIRIAILEKIQRDWKGIKEKKERIKCPF